jgi:hypothetical protein
VALEQLLLLLRRELAVVRDADVVVVGDEVEDVLLEVRARAADAVDLVLADHLGERDAELGRAHRARERHEHRAAAVHELRVALGRVDERRGVEVAEVVADELLDLRGVLHRKDGFG